MVVHLIGDFPPEAKSIAQLLEARVVSWLFWKDKAAEKCRLRDSWDALLVDESSAEVSKSEI